MPTRKRDYQDHSSDPPSSPPLLDMPPSSPPLADFGTGLSDQEGPVEEGSPGLDTSDNDDSEGEDLFENPEIDYRADPHQDVYDLEDRGIDDQEYEGLDIGERRRAIAMLARQNERTEREAGRQTRNRYLDSEGDEDSSGLPTRLRRRDLYGEGSRDDEIDLDEDEDEDDNDVLIQPLSLEALGDIKADSIAEWVVQPAVHKAIAREFKSFLLEYTDDKGRSVYGTRIRTLGEVNSESLLVSWKHLAEMRAILAYFLTVAPQEILQIFDVMAMEATKLHYPYYERIHNEIHVRITDIAAKFSLRDLREEHLNSLVRVTGVVTRRTGVFPQLKYIKFNCQKCGQVLGPYIQESHQEVKISFCHNCQSRGPFHLNSEKTVYRNYQRITLQESPGSVPAGRLPRHREIILLWDLIDQAKPGDEVEVIGIYKNSFDGILNAKNGFPVFSTIIEANFMVRRDAGHTREANLTEIEETEIRELARSPNIIERVIKSIAPSIYGHRNIKTAIACSLFGGVPKEAGKITLRGDINVLLLGDPGTAKSQMLKFAEATAHRAVYATGQGASAVGLTASVRKDPITREWTLEGGALVLSDKGTCLIDEFDKMNDQDRTSIHEAMEQQSISISKAGIVTTLRARCGVIAAANPIQGRYNASETLLANVNLTEPILSRFDVLCIVQDLANPENDERLAKFVVSSHAKASTAAESGEMEEQEPEENVDKDIISQDLLRKYIQYARSRIRPQLSNVNEELIAELYSRMRQRSLELGSFPMTVRHLESIIRLSESFAKMRLSAYVAQDDLQRAIRLTVDSFIQSQRAAQRKALRRDFLQYTQL